MADTDITYYKGMLENGQTRYQRDGWALPKNSRPGKWMPKVNVEMCASGYHVATIDQLPAWIAPAIYVVEVRGEHIQDRSKSAWAQARLVRRIDGWGMNEMVEWAKQCAEHVKHSSAAAANAASAAVHASNAAVHAVHASNAAVHAAYAAAYAAADAAYAHASNAAERAWQVSLLKSMLGV